MSVTLYFVGRNEKDALSHPPFDSFEQAAEYSSYYSDTTVYEAQANVDISTVEVSDG